MFTLPFKSVYQPVKRSFKSGRAVIITTSQATLDTLNSSTNEVVRKGPATGVYSSEMTEPYYVFQDAGLEVTLASIKGGEIPVEPMSLKFPIRTHYDTRFLNDPTAQIKLQKSIAVEHLLIDDFDIVFLSGGWGAAYDFAQSGALAEFISKAYVNRKIIASVCHGALGLVSAKRPDGLPIVKDAKVTGVTNRQLKVLGVTDTPLHPETELKRVGADYQFAHHFITDLFANKVTIDKQHHLVSGQNQKAGPEVADKALELFANQR